MRRIQSRLDWDVLFDDPLRGNKQWVDHVVADDAQARQVARPGGVAAHERGGVLSRAN